MANDCDLQYKTSKNQRLLVELTLMKLASITFDGDLPAGGQEKKKPDFLIPASHFATREVNNGNRSAAPKTNGTTPKDVEKTVEKTY